MLLQAVSARISILFDVLYPIVARMPVSVINRKLVQLKNFVCIKREVLVIKETCATATGLLRTTNLYSSYDSRQNIPDEIRERLIHTTRQAGLLSREELIALNSICRIILA